MERQASSPEYSDSSEIVSDPETESDFVPPSSLSPLLLTLSEEKRVEQCTRIGLVATHKCPSDILTEDDRREMAAIRASLGMLPRQSEVAPKKGGYLDEQEVRDCADTYQDSIRHQKEASEDEDSTRYQDTSQDSSRQFNEVNQNLIQTSYNKTGNRDCEDDVVRISSRQCNLLLETEEKGPIPRENSDLSASVRGEWSDSASDVMKLQTRNRTTCEDERRSRGEDKKYCRRQQERGQKCQHTVTTNNEWSEKTDNYGIGDRPLDYCGLTVRSKVYRGAGTTVKCRGPLKNSKKFAYSKLTNKQRPIRPSIHPAIDRRRYVADCGWLVCALCRHQFNIGQEGLRQEDLNSSLFRGSQLLTQHQASFMPCRPRVYHSTTLPLTTSQQCTMPSLLPPYVRPYYKPTQRDGYFQQYMMKKRRHATDWGGLPLCSVPPPSFLPDWRTADQSLGYCRAHAKVSRSLNLRPPPPRAPVARGYITAHKTYTNMFHSRSHK